jgi:hypothetical protein
MKKSFIITSMAAIAALCFSLTAQAQGPVVVSDKDDYSPGETAMFSAAGFEPNELLDFSIAVQDDQGLWVPDIAWADVPADASGGAEVDYLVPETWLNKTLQLTVMGLSSGLMAQTTFTDAPIQPTVTINASPTPPVGDGTHVMLGAALSSSPAPNCGKMQVQLSTDGGTSWTTVASACAPNSAFYDYDTTGHCSDSPAPQFKANFAPGGGSPCTNCGGTFSGADSDPVTINITCPSGTPTPTPTATPVNQPPVITCASAASPSPTPVDLGQAVGCLGDGGFTHDFPVSYGCSPASCVGNPVTVQATFTKADNTTVTADVATVSDPDVGDTVTVSLSGGTDPVTISGPCAGSSTFTVHITAVDNHGASAAPADCGGMADATIVYAFSGFFPPLDGQRNCKVKQGSGIPVKFQISDCNGTLITPDNIPGDFPTIDVVYLSGAVPTGDPTVGDAGMSGDNGTTFRWDPTGMQWIFNLKTNSTYAVGNTYSIIADLHDCADPANSAAIAIKR